MKKSLRRERAGREARPTVRVRKRDKEKRRR
jgi:hypothetical protein